MERRKSFDTVAEQYDATRPEYPAALVDRVVAGLPADARLLEIGCGTGKATRAYVERGFDPLCLEPGANLAAIARRKLGVTVVETDFERWEGEPAAFDRVVCAQAWHFLDPAVRYERVARLLAPRGVLALYWNLSLSVFAEGQEAYRRWLPARANAIPDVGERIETPRRELNESGRFGEVEVSRFPWTRRYTADEYLGVAATYSDHILLDDETRRGLFEDLRGCIEARGGTCERSYEAVLYLAPVRT